MTTATRALPEQPVPGGSNPAKGPLIDAEPTRQHVRTLMAAGVSIQRIAAAANVSHSIVSNTLYRRGPQPRSGRIRQANANSILAIRADQVVTGRVDATGTRRRIQALMANGWSQLQLGPHLGIHPHYVTNLLRATHVYATTAHAAAVAYNRLWDQNPLHHGGYPQGVSRVRNYARAKGWAPPAAWDEDIDDPAAVPQTGEDTPLGRDELAALRREEIEHLGSYGIPEEQIAERVGLNKVYVRDILTELRTGVKRDRRQQTAGAA